jgi:hypothetical protein
MGHGLRAISAIGDALKRAPIDDLKRICCPLCRRPWPSEDAVPLDSILGQLGELRALTLSNAVKKMVQALSQARDHFEHGIDAIHARMTKGMLELDAVLYSASSFFASQCANIQLLANILIWLRCRDVKHLSLVSTSCCHICFHGAKLRLPHVSVRKFKTAMHHASTSDLVTLEVVTPPNDPCLTALDMLTCSKWLSSCSSLVGLVMSGTKWEKLDPGGNHLGNCLTDKPLRILDLSSNFLMDESLQCLATALMPKESTYSTLEVLSLNFNYITDIGLASILPLALRIGGGMDWSFRHNKLGDSGCDAISKTLFTKHVGCHVSGTSWDLRTNRISAKGIKSLLCVFPSMSVARLGCNPIGDMGAIWLAHGIGESLRVLDLGQASIGDEGAAVMAKKLVNASCLQDLLLHGNVIGPAGAISLADGWAWVTNLRFVDLAYNPIGDSGVRGIAQELPCWTQAPFRLSLAGVDCDDEGARCLVSVLGTNPRRGWNWKFDLGNNKCSHVHISSIRQLLEEQMPMQ